jgi:hypothetical protein
MGFSERPPAKLRMLSARRIALVSEPSLGKTMEANAN